MSESIDPNSSKPRDRRWLPWVALAVILAGAGVAAYVNRDQWMKMRAKAAADLNAPKLVDESAAVGRAGLFDIKFTARSPLSDPKSVIARCNIDPKWAGNDYALKDRLFSVYKPKEPNPGGNYGLMIGLCFKGYGPPPASWQAVLETHHLIWVCPYDNGDNEQPEAGRVGLLLDAVDNAKRLWQIDPARIYLSAGTYEGTAAGAAFYYPEIFRGVIESPVIFWFDDSVHRRFPLLNQLDTARECCRVFVADRHSTDPQQNGNDNRVLVQGYRRSGFKHVKMIYVPEADIGHYVNYAGDWFEQGVMYLEGAD